MVKKIGPAKSVRFTYKGIACSVLSFGYGPPLTPRYSYELNLSKPFFTTDFGYFLM